MFMEQQRGIWIDRHKAMIVDPTVNQKEFTQISSPLTSQTSDSISQSRLGDQYLNPEKKLQAKRKQLLKDYYNNVIESLENDSELYIFGPAEAKTELHKAIYKSCKQFRNITLHPSDNLTENQIVAKVKEFFKN